MTSDSKSVLAIVRCGDNSLHPMWATPDRMFDVGISYYGDDDQKVFPEADYIQRGKGGKWDGISNFFKQFPDVLEQYDYFWLPDDDISATATDINRLILIASEQELSICQPALDDRSYYSHYITLHHPSFILRHTNFVEIMAPLIGAPLLKQTLPMLAETRSGFGLDFLWPKLAEKSSGTHKSAAIVDGVRVRHTRPVGGNLHAFMKKVGGNSVLDELKDTLENIDVKREATINGVAVPRIKNLSGVDVSGHYRDGLKLTLMTAYDLRFKFVNRVQPTRPIAVVRHALKSIL